MEQVLTIYQTKGTGDLISSDPQWGIYLINDRSDKCSMIN